VLSTFEIRNFRTFSHLPIQRFGRVNLIVGRNCVGKTALLEALWLYAARMRPGALHQLLWERQELVAEVDSESQDFEVDVRALFHGRTYLPESQNQITLGPIDSPESRIGLRLSYVERELSSEPAPPTYVEIRDEGTGSPEGEVFPALVVSVGGQEQYLVRRYESWFRSLRRFPMRGPESLPPFLRAETVDEDMIGHWWDSVSLRESEARVVAYLNVLAPVERINLIGSPRRRSSRVFMVRLRGEKNPQPLKSLGDGVERMFRTAVAIEYARRSIETSQLDLLPTPAFSRELAGNILLVDEVESGIHYTAIAKYWEMIFALAHELDVQVFATTHSWDCVLGFQHAVAQTEPNEGFLIRLEKKDDKCRAVVFNREELSIVTRENIEVR